jgi:antitoxin VapB
MDTAKIFNNGRSQAVRLPKEYRFKDDEVCVAKLDDMVILFPAGKGWELLEKGIQHFTDDFMASRDQSGKSERRAKL